MKQYWYKSFLSVLLVLSQTGISSALSYDSDLEVLSSNRTEFHFRVTIRPSNLEQQIESDSTVTLYCSVPVGIPFGSRVTLLEVTADSLVPAGGQSPAVDNWSDRIHPPAVVTDPVTIRGRQSVAVQIFPTVGDAIYHSVTVRLQFTGGSATGAAVSDPLFDRIFQSSLANYNQFRTWSTMSVQKTPIAAPTAHQLEASSVWYKIAVNQTGLVKITGAQLAQAGLILDDLPSDSLHLFNAGGLQLPIDNSQPRPELIEMAIDVQDGGDGVFHSNDYFLFYGETVDRWLYTADQSPQFINNHYCDRNIYWLTVSGLADAGRRMTQVDAGTGGAVDTVITAFNRHVHLEQDNLLRRLNSGHIDDYYRWYWTKETDLTFWVSAPGNITGDIDSVRLTGLTNDNNIVDDDYGFIDLYVNGGHELDGLRSRTGCSYRSTRFVDGANEIRLRLWKEFNAPPYFDHFDLVYTSRLVADHGQLDITLGNFTGAARLSVVDSFPSSVIVLDLADPLRPAMLTGYERSGGMLTLRHYFSIGSPNRLYLTSVDRADNPAAIERVSPANLKSNNTRADLLIVTAHQLKDALADYVDYRRDRGPAVEVVTVSDIMDNFGYGLYDPTAIRDFLKYAYEHYSPPAPATVLMVGDANYDFLNHLRTGVSNYVPAYIHAYDQSASDDNYVYFGRYGILDSDTSFDTGYVSPDRGYDMLVARWPVRTAGEISTIMSKIRCHESPTSLGLWRTNVTLVADDEYGRYSNETFHVTQTEILEKNYLPRLFNRNKIYLWEYPLVNMKKPAVNDLIVDAFNDGSLVINFAGHGNPDVWTDEQVFTRTGDLSRLRNQDRLPLIFSASCEIGFFDDPGREGMAEDLLVYRQGGASGTVTATRLVNSFDNALFNQKFFDVLFKDNSLSVGEAVYTAKLLRQYGSSSVPSQKKNDQAYLFFGDPCLKLGAPRLKVEFSEPPDSLIALGRTHVVGRVIDQNDQLYERDGSLMINVFDSERSRTHRVINSSGDITQEIDYTVTGPTIFRGSAGITGGFFDFVFICPLDLGYGGNGARIVVYAVLDTIDAAGLIDSITVSDSIVTVSDSTGPDIECSIPGRAGFVSGDIVSRHDRLQITLSDSSGINLTAALGHGITLELDDRSENTYDLTELFEYYQDDYTRGQLIYPFEDMPPGKHTFKIKAWDNANNSATHEFSAEVLTEEKLAIIELLNYPNPMKDFTRFSAQLSRPVSQFLLEIFTLSGRKIKSFGPLYPSAGYYDDIVWYGRDDSGDRVATGVYIYRATAVPADGGETVESFGKVVVIN
ncbi:MAG: type IX secretion system sortase PorU [bacterium]